MQAACFKGTVIVDALRGIFVTWKTDCLCRPAKAATFSLYPLWSLICPYPLLVAILVNAVPLDRDFKLGK